MPRPANILRPVKLTTTFPEDIRARLDLYLYSDLERRVPQGAYQRFLTDRTREFFTQSSLDLGLISTEAVPGRHIVRGSAETITLLSKLLSEKFNDSTKS